MAKKKSGTDHTKNLIKLKNLVHLRNYWKLETGNWKLLKKPSQAKFIVKTEKSYYTNTHKMDKMQCPEPHIGKMVYAMMRSWKTFLTLLEA